MKTFPSHIYSGQSMAPLFRPGDSLRMEAVAFEQVRPGDVIVFRPAGCEGQDSEGMSLKVSARPGAGAAPWPPSATEGNQRVVHRVMALRSEGFITRGDANPSPDEGFVTPDQLEGRVAALERDGTTRHVFGGRVGHLRAGLARIGQRLGRPARRIASAPYCLLRASHIVRHWWNPKLRTLSLATPQGALVKFLHGNRTVARWWPGSGRFECRKPYDLVLRRPDGPRATPDDLSS